MLDASWTWTVNEVQLSSIGKLKQLRSLNLSNSSIQALPNTICDLEKLQILNLNWCFNLVKLPKNMRYMDSLRHLLLEECDSLIEIPSRIGDLTSLKTLSQFIVRDKIGNHLGELEHLNLGGKLEIKHLERVKNQMDAKIANLSAKPNLRDLVLKWDGDNASESREMMDTMVLEALKPHPNIEVLKIFGFKGKVFPLWMGNSVMNNVVEIDIDNCPNCLNLPPLGYLPQLKSLCLMKLEKIEFIMEDEVEGGKSFPSLEKLYLWSLSNLKAFSRKEGREMSPNLQMLSIIECSLLRLPPLPSLKELFVSKCSDSILSSFSKLNNLASLNMRFDENITSSCENLVEENGIKYLHALKRLTLKGVPQLACLPEGLQHLHSLERLYLNNLQQLTSLPDWLDKLTSLNYLSIRTCPRIASLPSNIQRMTNLQTLEIWGCPELKRRCEQGTGEDWHEIAHVPELRIG